MHMRTLVTVCLCAALAACDEGYETEIRVEEERRLVPVIVVAEDGTHNRPQVLGEGVCVADTLTDLAALPVARVPSLVLACPGMDQHHYIACTAGGCCLERDGLAAPLACSGAP